MNLYQITITTILVFFVTSKISSQEITMFPGFWGYQYYEDDIKITKNEVNNLMQKHDLTKVYWNKSKKHKTYGIISFGAQLLTSLIALNSLSNTIDPVNSTDKILIGFSLTSGAVAIGFSLSSASLKKKAILSYNKLQSTEGLLLYIGQTKNGIGLVYSF